MALALPTYETDQLVSMIGSKRPIIDQLRLIFAPLVEKCRTPRFLDPFCGSGAVSRLARSMGMRVEACDLEPFSFILNTVYLSLSSDDLAPLFSEMGGIDAYLSMLNLHGLYAAQTGMGFTPYLSRHYAPQDDEHADGFAERLFFSSANARFLDAVREEIEVSWLEGKMSALEKAVILCSILYEASRRANTSGTFTAYHKRLDSSRTRIRERCQLRAPVLPDADLPSSTMQQSDASAFLKGRSADICYLDPPATVHQYGSAYHLLNSITLWDGYTPSGALDEQGRLVDRSGIRTDWKQTHSAYCSLKQVDAAFIHLFGAIDSRYIVLSYPTSGLISAQRIIELLSARHAPVTVIPLHRRNQGGRQGFSGKKNIEQIFIAGKEASFSISAGEALARLPVLERLDKLTAAVFSRSVAMPPLRFVGGVAIDGPLPTQELLAMPLDRLEQLVSQLEETACTSADEAMHALFATIETGVIRGAERAKLEKRALSLFRSELERDDFDTLENLVLLAEGSRLYSRFHAMMHQRRGN